MYKPLWKPKLVSPVLAMLILMVFFMKEKNIVLSLIFLYRTPNKLQLQLCTIVINTCIIIWWIFILEKRLFFSYVTVIFCCNILSTALKNLLFIIDGLPQGSGMYMSCRSYNFDTTYRYYLCYQWGNILKFISFFFRINRKSWNNICEMNLHK